MQEEVGGRQLFVPANTASKESVVSISATGDRDVVGNDAKAKVSIINVEG